MRLIDADELKAYVKIFNVGRGCNGEHQKEFLDAIDDALTVDPERKKGNDCMEFPDTVEEFMEQYKIVDTEEVYTNGIAMVPIFRMKEWFAHKEVMRMKCLLDYKDEKSKALRHYSVITPAGTFQIDAEKVYIISNLKLKPVPEVLRFIVEDETIAEFYIKDIYGWFERGDQNE